MKNLFYRLFGGKMTYRRAFIISLFLNLLLLLFLSIFFKQLANPILSSKELKVEFMTQQEVQQMEEEIQAAEENSGREGGTAGTKQSAKQANPNEPDSGTQDPNTYSENGNPNPDPRQSSDPGTSSNVSTNGVPGGQGKGSSGDIHGKSSGASDPKPAKNPGYVDISGYQSRLSSLALNNYPPSAQDLGRQGTVIYKVTFDTNGNPIDASLVKSSGTSILDKHAYKMIFQAGKITNTTGNTVTREVKVRYVL